MARKTRIDIPGYYHIINRGVNRETIFPENKDKDQFLGFLDMARDSYQLTIHAFCLLDNHYHLLIETTRNNLSLAVRYFNSRYAAWYNRKLLRSGPLWQGRFKSCYIYDEDYLWLLLRYIERHPVTAGIAQAAGEYPYSASYALINNPDAELLLGSVLHHKDIREWLLPLTVTEQGRLTDFQSTRIEPRNEHWHMKQKIALRAYFPVDQTRQRRNFMIRQAFMDGYKQSEIARYVNLSTVAVSRIIDREKQKQLLFNKIRDKGLLWSYAADIEYSTEKQNVLIETVLKYADLADIRLLFELFGLREVRRLWERQVRYDIRFKKLNYFLARIFFSLNLEADDFNESKDLRAQKLRLLAG